MNLQTLKDNRAEIIERATELVGEDRVKEVMNLMVKNIENTTYDNAISYLEEIVEMYFPGYSSRKDSKLTQMRANHESNNNIRYNQLTKSYEKY